MAKNRTMADVVADLKKLQAEGNKLIADKKPLSVDFLDKFSVLEKEYADLMAKSIYDELKAKDMPMIEAITRYSYEVIRHQIVRDAKAKVVSEIKLVNKDKQIDLLKFSKHAELDTTWQHIVSLFNQTLCLRAADELGYSDREIKQIADTYYIAQQLREKADGKPVTSNNALTKKLQGVIDAILPPADEQVGNTYKCNNHDVKFLLMAYTKKGRTALSVAISKDGFLRNLVMDVLHRIITDGKYSLEYKTRKDAVMVRAVAQPEVEPAITEEDETEDKAA